MKRARRRNRLAIVMINERKKREPIVSVNLSLGNFGEERSN